jgi:hypothetical protein
MIGVDLGDTLVGRGEDDAHMDKEAVTEIIKSRGATLNRGIGRRQRDQVKGSGRDDCHGKVRGERMSRHHHP